MMGTLSRAIVRRVDDGDAWVEAVDQGCGRCHEPGGCGGYRAMVGGKRVVRIANRCHARVDDLVEISVPLGTVSRMATATYVMPLIGLVLGSAVASGVYGAQGDAAGVFGACVGAIAGLGLSRFLVRRQDFGIPTMVRICTTDCLEK